MSHTVRLRQPIFNNFTGPTQQQEVRIYRVRKRKGPWEEAGLQQGHFESRQLVEVAVLALLVLLLSVRRTGQQFRQIFQYEACIFRLQ